MAITVLSKTQPIPLDGGQQGMYQQFFNCAFSTTDLSGTVPSGIRKVVYRSAFSFLSEGGVDEAIHWNNSNNTDGSAVLATGELLSISRGAMAPTSALKFGFFIVGFI